MDEFLLYYGYQIMTYLGWANIVLTVIALSLFLSRRMNRKLYGNQNSFLRQATTLLRTLHPYIGGLLLISAYIHGELALGTVFKLHTGPLAWWIVLVMMIIALAGKQYKIKYWLRAHRGLAVLMLCSVLLHLFARNII